MFWTYFDGTDSPPSALPSYSDRAAIARLTRVDKMSLQADAILGGSRTRPPCSYLLSFGARRQAAMNASMSARVNITSLPRLKNGNRSLKT
jgi:hypothetical protein